MKYYLVYQRTDLFYSKPLYLFRMGAEPETNGEMKQAARISFWVKNVAFSPSTTFVPVGFLYLCLQSACVLL